MNATEYTFLDERVMFIPKTSKLTSKQDGKVLHTKLGDKSYDGPERMLPSRVNNHCKKCYFYWKVRLRQKCEWIIYLRLGLNKRMYNESDYYLDFIYRSFK